MHAHLIQLNIAWEDKDANFSAVRRLVDSARVSPGDLVVLPEMFDTGFSFNLPRTGDDDGRTLSFLKEVARAHSVFVHGARTAIEPGGRARNRASIVSPDGAVLCEYDKIHPFTIGQEQDHFTGGSVVTTYPWSTPSGGSAVVCPVICYDLRFPELFRIGLLKGAQVYVVIADWLSTRHVHWRTLAIARAIENQAFVLAVNRVGRDPNAEYLGGSIAVGPRGEVLGELGADEGVLSVEVDPAAVQEWRARFPAWRDHRLIGRTS